MLSYGWLEIGVLFSTAYARSVRRSPARMREDACATRNWHCQWCSGRRYATLAAHTVSVRQCRAPATGTLAAGRRFRSLINRIKVRAVRWPMIRWNERRRCSRSRTVSGASVLGHCPVERRKIPLIPRASRGVAVSAVVSAVDLNARVDEDEVCAAQLRYADRHQGTDWTWVECAGDVHERPLCPSSSIVCYLQRIFNKNQKLKQK